MTKEAVIIAGANGSGKTTFAGLYTGKYPFEFVNADEIAKKIAHTDGDKTLIKAGKLFFERIDHLIGANRSLIIESTLSGRSLLNLIKKVKQKDYLVKIVYIFLETPGMCIERIKERVRKGGHFIPDHDVIRRYSRSKINFWNLYKKEADEWFLIHNSQPQFVEFALGSGNEYVINDYRLFDLFIREIKEEADASRETR